MRGCAGAGELALIVQEQAVHLASGKGGAVDFQRAAQAGVGCLDVLQAVVNGGSGDQAFDRLIAFRVLEFFLQRFGISSRDHRVFRQRFLIVEITHLHALERGEVWLQALENHRSRYIANQQIENLFLRGEILMERRFRP